MKDTIGGEWKFSEQISYEQPKLKCIKPNKMWKNRRAYKKRKFKCKIKFEEEKK